MAPTQAADNGGIQDLLGGLADAASRRYAERYRDDARWDGKYYYDRYDNRRYTRSEWQREIQRRARAEDEGRLARQQASGVGRKEVRKKLPPV